MPTYEFDRKNENPVGKLSGFRLRPIYIQFSGDFPFSVAAMLEYILYIHRHSSHAPVQAACGGGVTYSVLEGRVHRYAMQVLRVPHKLSDRRLSCGSVSRLAWLGDSRNENY